MPSKSPHIPHDTEVYESKQIVLDITPDTDINISRKAKKVTPRYILIGTGMTNGFYSTINLIEVLLELPKSVQNAFKTINNARDYRTGMSEVDLSNYTTSQRNKFYIAVRELTDIELVIRVKPSVYMINPRAVIPSTEELKFLIYSSWYKAGGSLPEHIIDDYKLSK